MSELENSNITKRNAILYKIEGNKAVYEFLIEEALNHTYRAYLLRMWGDADLESPRTDTRCINDHNETNSYITRKPAPRSREEALKAAQQWVAEGDRRGSIQPYSSRPQPSRVLSWDKVKKDGQHPTVLKMTHEVWSQIKATVGSKPAETGGPLGGSRKGFLVEHFYFDYSSTRSAATYSPDDAELNRIFKNDWNPRGLYLLGFVHSHPAGICRPSGGDIHYARQILQAIPELDYLLLPIVQSEADTGHFNIHPYAAVRGGRDIAIVPLTLEIQPAAQTDVRPSYSPSPGTMSYVDAPIAPHGVYTDIGGSVEETDNDSPLSDVPNNDSPFQ